MIILSDSIFLHINLPDLITKHIIAMVRLVALMASNLPS